MIEILLKGYKSYSPFHIGILFAAPVFAAPFFFILLLLLLFFFLCNSLTERHQFFTNKSTLLAAYATDKNSEQHTRADAILAVNWETIVFKTDSKEPKNKSEFYFLSADWSRSVFHTGYKVQFAMLLSSKILQVVLQPIIKKR